MRSSTMTEEAQKLLWNWGIKVDPGLRILICCTCGVAIPANLKRILTHIQKHHTTKGKTVGRMYPDLGPQLDRILRSYDFEDLKSVLEQPPDRPRIDGIKVHKGFYCPVVLDGRECLKTFPQHSTMKQHLSNDHKGFQTPTSSEIHNHLCDCQTLTVERKHYFRVLSRPTAAAERHQDLYITFIQDEMPNIPGNSTKSLEPMRREELPSLLRQTEWHKFVAEYRNDPEDVVKLILFPDRVDNSDEGRLLSRLPRIAEAWMRRVHKHQQESTSNMRKFLNGFPIK